MERGAAAELKRVALAECVFDSELVRVLAVFGGAQHRTCFVHVLLLQFFPLLKVRHLERLGEKLVDSLFALLFQLLLGTEDVIGIRSLLREQLGWEGRRQDVRVVNLMRSYDGSVLKSKQRCVPSRV